MCSINLSPGWDLETKKLLCISLVAPPTDGHVSHGMSHMSENILKGIIK